jgi:hypothetical protein
MVRQYAKGEKREREHKREQERAARRAAKFARKAENRAKSKLQNNTNFSAGPAQAPSTAVTPSREPQHQQQPRSNEYFDPLFTVKNKNVNGGTPFTLRWSTLTPEAQGITDPRQKVQWYEDTMILMDAKLDENGIRNARLGHVEVKGPNAGRWNKPSRDPSFIASTEGGKFWIDGQHCYPRQKNARTHENVLGTNTMNMNVKMKYDNPGENGYYALEAGENGGSRKGGDGQRILAFANWVSVAKIRHRDYHALVKFLRPKVQYDAKDPSKENNHANLMAVARRLENDADFMANERQMNEQALTASSMTSQAAKVPSLQEIASAVSSGLENKVGEKVVEGPSNAGTFSGMGVMP